MLVSFGTRGGSMIAEPRNHEIAVQEGARAQNSATGILPPNGVDFTNPIPSGIPVSAQVSSLPLASTSNVTSSAYEDPALAAVDIIYVGAGKFADSSSTNARRSALEASILASLSDGGGQAVLRDLVEEFYKRAAASHPELRLRVVSGKVRRILGETMDRTAFAAIALNHATLIESGFQPGTGEQQLFLSLPLFLISAKSYHLIHCSPIFVRVRMEPGVSPADPAITQRVLAGVRYMLNSRAVDPRQMALLAEALKRGTFRDPSRIIYSMGEDAVTFSENAGNAATGFKDTSAVAQVLREALCAFLASSECVFPPIDARLSSRLYRDLGADYYGLEVITDLNLPRGFPISDSGRLILPVSRVAADVNLKVHVKSGTRTLEQGQHLSKGECQVVLELTGENSAGNVLRERTFADTESFTRHVSETGRADGECLMNSLLAATAKTKAGFNP